jgi:hypothetical protein
MNRIIPLAGLLLLACLATGCTTADRQFPDRDPATVWQTLIAVANEPDYDGGTPEQRWVVEENHVWVDEANTRLEIYRTVKRVLHRPGAKPLPQRQSWRFQVLFDGGEPPMARFVSRGLAVPSKAQFEAERFFSDVESLLYGAGSMIQPASQPDAMSDDADDDSIVEDMLENPPVTDENADPQPEIDIDDLEEPGG